MGRPQWGLVGLLVKGRERGVAEDCVGAADVAHGAKIGDRKAVKVLRLVAHGPELEATISDGKPAAAPVIDGLNSRILKRILDQVVARIGRQVESETVLLANGEEGLNLLALNVRSGGTVFVGSVEEGMACLLYTSRCV